MISYIVYLCSYYSVLTTRMVKELKNYWSKTPSPVPYKEFKERGIWIAAARAAKHERNLQLHALYAKHFWSNPIQLKEQAK